MSTTTMDSRAKTKKHNWGMFFWGLLIAICGVTILAWPGLSLISLAIAAGVVLIFAGVSDFYMYSKMSGLGGAGWVLATGICDVLLGALFIIFPITSAAMLPWLAGAFLICYSIFMIAAGASARNILPGYGWLIATGIVGILCGIMFFAMPTSFAIFMGIFLIMRGATISITGIVAPNEDFLL